MGETDWIVTKQIAVKATTPEEAVAKSIEGKTISLTAAARPQLQQRPQGMALPSVVTNMKTGQPV